MAGETAKMGQIANEDAVYGHFRVCEPADALDTKFEQSSTSLCALLRALY